MLPSLPSTVPGMEQASHKHLLNRHHYLKERENTGESRNCCSQWHWDLEEVDQRNWKMEDPCPARPHILNIYTQKSSKQGPRTVLFL